MPVLPGGKVYHVMSRWVVYTTRFVRYIARAPLRFEYRDQYCSMDKVHWAGFEGECNVMILFFNISGAASKTFYLKVVLKIGITIRFGVFTVFFPVEEEKYRNEFNLHINEMSSIYLLFVF